jgi:Mg-chelatase subunit ChlD
VEQIASQSSSSKVGLVTFSGTLSGKQYSYAEMTTANKNALINHIWSITASGGTCPGEGLSLANNILSTSGDNNPKYVIMFTDGDPSGDGDGWNETNAYWAKYNAETAAKNVKKNASLYTIALSPSASNARWLKNTIATSSDGRARYHLQ